MDSMKLVLRARRGNRRALTELLANCEHVITFHAHRLSPTQPDDLAQHLRMVVIDLGVRTFDGRAAWCTWVSRICSTRGLDYLKQQKRQGRGFRQIDLAEES